MNKIHSVNPSGLPAKPLTTGLGCDDCLSRLTIAVLAPCFNEGATIGRVVADFGKALPTATVYVYDNNSRDDTARVAREAGAVVRHERLQGKGNVVRRMFADVEADVYVLVDGDGTYDAASAPAMVRTLLEEGCDMVTGVREESCEAAYRPAHRLGNRLFTGMVARLFGERIPDLLSGYRVLSRRLVKSFPSDSRGFEIETELSVHALELRVGLLNLATPYGSRPEGSVSKLSTLRDGLRILHRILMLIKEERPFALFGLLGLILALASLALAVPLFVTYAETGLVPRFPTAILAMGMMLLAFMFLGCGIVLDSVCRSRREMRRLAYLQYAAPPGDTIRTDRIDSHLNDPSGRFALGAAP